LVLLRVFLASFLGTAGALLGVSFHFGKLLRGRGRGINGRSGDRLRLALRVGGRGPQFAFSRETVYPMRHGFEILVLVERVCAEGRGLARSSPIRGWDEPQLSALLGVRSRGLLFELDVDMVGLHRYRGSFGLERRKGVVVAEGGIFDRLRPP